MTHLPVGFGVVDPDLYESFDDLCENIKQHNISTDGPVTIISADDPMHLTLGWACVETEKVWKIKIGTLKRWFESQKVVNSDCDIAHSNRVAFVRKAIQTTEGKLTLSATFSNLGK
jgi:hypothetical protein